MSCYRPQEDYAETQERLVSLYPAWDKENDVRLTMFYKIATVLNCTQHGLVHLINDMLDEGWWRRNTGIFPNGKVLEDHAEGFDTFCKTGCLFGTFSMFECSIRQIVRAIEPAACSTGTAEFAGVYSWLLKRLGLQKYESLLKLLGSTRNTIHNNGAFFHQSRSDQIVVHKGINYEFFIGKYVEFVSWDFLLNRLAEVRQFMEDVATAPEVTALPRIDDP